MSNDTPNWMNKWQRSPRQDRRVLIDGKFVEQGPVQYPEPPQEEQPESALEVVQEPIDAVAEHLKGSFSVSNLVEAITPVESVINEKFGEKQDVDKAFEFLEIPPVPAEAWQFIGSAQNEGNLISGSVEAPAVLPAIGEDTAGEGILDGQVGRVEQAEESIEDATNPVVDPASVDDLPF